MHEPLSTGSPPRPSPTPQAPLPSAQLTEHEIRYQLYSPQVDDRLGIAKIILRLPQISPRILSDILVAGLREPSDAVRQELSTVLGDISRQMPQGEPLMGAWQDFIAVPDLRRGYQLPQGPDTSAQLARERNQRVEQVVRLTLTDARLPLPLRVASAAALLRQGPLPAQFDELARYFIDQKGGLPLLLAGAATDLTSAQPSAREHALARLTAYAKRLPRELVNAGLGRLDDPVVHIRKAALILARQLDQAYPGVVRMALIKSVAAEAQPQLQSMLVETLRSPFRAPFSEVEQMLHTLTNIARTNRQLGGSQQRAIECMIAIAAAWSGPPIPQGSTTIPPMTPDQRNRMASSVIAHLISIEEGTQLDLQVEALRSAGELARQAKASGKDGSRLFDRVRRATLALMDRAGLDDEHRQKLKNIIPYTPPPPPPPQESNEQ